MPRRRPTRGTRQRNDRGQFQVSHSNNGVIDAITQSQEDDYDENVFIVNYNHDDTATGLQEGLQSDQDTMFVETSDMEMEVIDTASFGIPDEIEMDETAITNNDNAPSSVITLEITEETVMDENIITDNNLSSEIEELGAAITVARSIDRNALNSVKTWHVNDSDLSNCCEKCLRENTPEHNIDIQATPRQDSWSKKKFGVPLRNQTIVNLCLLCRNYMFKNVWKYAWASVLCTLFFFGRNMNCNGEYLFTLFPASFTESWKTAANHVGFEHQNSLPVFNDFNCVFKNFTSIMSQRKAKLIKYWLNFFTFPFVKCPAGCSVQIHSTGRISFKHLLNLLFPAFKDFKANKKNLTCMRSDFLRSVIHLGSFFSSPCFEVDANGLNLVTCVQHEYITHKKFIHMPILPCGNQVHANSDRLAVLATKTRDGTPCRAGKFSHTYTMATSVGGYSGISAIQLTSTRRLNTKSEKLLPQSEILFYNKRIDIQNHVRILYNQFELDDDFLSYLLDTSQLPSETLLTYCMSTSTSLTKFSMLSIHEYLESQTSMKVFIPPSLTINHNCDSYGCEPLIPTNKLAKKNISLFIVNLCNLNLELFGHTLLNVCNTHQLYINYLNNIMKCQNVSHSKGLEYLCRTFNLDWTKFENKKDFSLLCHVAEQLPYCELILCTLRSNVSYIDGDISNNGPQSNVKILIVLCQQGISRTHGIPEKVQKFGIMFNLSMIISDIKDEVLFRYGYDFVSWWYHNYRTQITKKVSEDLNTIWNILSKCWNCLVYIADYRNLVCLSDCSFFSRQTKIMCNEHLLPLSTDFNNTTFNCSVEQCRRRSKWRCPKHDCSCCCCSFHFRIFDSSNEKYFIHSSQQSFNMSSDSESDLSCFLNENVCANTCEDNNEEFFEFGLSETGYLNDPTLQSESTLLLPKHEIKNNNVPIHVLLNQTLQILKRVKNPKPLSKRFLRFFQNFAASNPTDVVSFLQVEALMSPSLFYKQLSDGSFPGALPYFLYNEQAFNDKLNYASFYDHFHSRMTNLELAASGNINYSYMLIDSLLNLNLNHSLTLNFFKRGIQNIEIKGIPLQQQDGPSRKYSLTDSSKNVRELSAAMRDSCATLFFTITLNMKKHPGIAPIYQAIEQTFSDRFSEEYKAAMQSYMPTILRMWSMTVEYLIDYLLNSSENLLGEIIDFWGRCEFQSLVGNVPHYHFLLWLRENDFDSLQKLVASTKRHLMYHFETLFASEIDIVRNKDDISELFNDFVTIQTHSCEKNNFRCQKKTDLKTNTKVCRFLPYKPSNHIWLKAIPQNFSEDAVIILKKIGLITDFDDEENYIDKELACSKYSYAAVPGEHMMPNSPALFAITRSSGNVLFVTENFSCKYLNKYAAGKEEHPDVKIKGGYNKESFNVRISEIENTKISGVQIGRNETKMMQRETAGINALHVAHTELVWWSLKLPCILTSFDFVHVPSVALEHRGAIPKKSLNNAMNYLASLRENLNLPSFCYFTINQKIMIEDLLYSKLSVDKVTKFSVRPPQLLFIKKMKFFYSHFTTVKKISKKEDLICRLKKFPVPWIDGCNCLLQVRSSSLETLKKYIAEKLVQNNDVHYRRFKRILDNIHSEPFKSTFLCEDTNLSQSPAVVVFSTVYPKNSFKFLLHLLYTMGEFDTEIDLFNARTLRGCFVKANILPDGILNETHVTDLLKKYVLEQMKFLPGGSLSFSNRIVSAYESIHSLVMEDRADCLNFPCVLMSTLSDKTETSIRDYIRDTQSRLLQALNPPNVTNLPNNSASVGNTLWIPEFVKLPVQTDASFNEQLRVIENIIFNMKKYMNKDKTAFSCHLIMGNPGAGKSYVSGVCLLFGLLNGLNCYVTSLASRRAATFNCEHIHRLFGICVTKFDVATTVDKALRKLKNKPKYYALLLSIDVLLIEEVGVISSELLSIIDLLFQNLKNNSCAFGGVFIICNGDTNQLPNIDGTNVFLSPLLLFCFRAHFLRHYVRMLDAEGRELLEKMTLKPISKHDIDIIKKTIEKKCNFVSSWEEIEDKRVMKVFGKRTAEQEAIKHFHQEIRSSGEHFCEIIAFDEMCPNLSSNWQDASNEVVNFLNKECAEPKKLTLKKHCILRLTKNTDDLSQGNVCILAEIPNCNDSSITVYVAPHVDAVMDADLFVNNIFLNWKQAKLHKTVGYCLAMGKVSVRRTQMPVTNYVALTVHKLMGDTFFKLATQVSVTEQKFTLWMASQLYVILSRVKDLCNITFVGQK